MDLGFTLVLLSFCPLFAGLYPLTQLYQFEEDSRRGDRTLALMIGMQRSLTVALVCVLLAFALLGAGAILRGVGSWGLLLAVPLAAWLWVLIPWRRAHAAWRPDEHQRGMYRALAAWALTDIVVILVFAR